jgi:hypothetical protein
MENADLVIADEARLPALPGPRFSDRFRRTLGLSVRLMCLDPEAARELASRNKLTGPALLVAYLGTIGAHFPFMRGMADVAVASAAFALLIVPLMAMQHLAVKSLGGKASYTQFVRTMYATNAVYMVGFVPVIGAPLVAAAVIWDCIVTTCAMAAVSGVSTCRAAFAYAAVTVPLLMLLL